MAVLYITEVDTLGIDANGKEAMAPVYPTLVPPYSMAITAGSTQSQVFSNQTRMLELHCDVICSFAIGTNPTAVVTAGRLGSGERIFYSLRPGVTSLRIAVISNT
jgi:hypothetical protein